MIHSHNLHEYHMELHTDDNLRQFHLKLFRLIFRQIQSFFQENYLLAFDL